jgi:hypothetical protein
MAITTTNLNGTDSVSASRITLNDNFATIVDALNDVLAIVDIATGKINNYGYGSNNDIETEDLIVRGSVGGGINVISGNINVQNGNVVVGNTNYFQVGSGAGNSIFLSKITKTLGAGNIPTVSFTGVGTTAPTASDPVGYVTVPRLTTGDINGIISPLEGSIVYDLSMKCFKGCTGSSSGVGGSTWVIL